MLKKLLIIVFALAALVMVYLSAPFVFFPCMFSKDLQTHSIWSSVWNHAYAPLVVSLSDDNLYKLQFDQMMVELCDEHPDRCVDPSSH